MTFTCNNGVWPNMSIRLPTILCLQKAHKTAKRRPQLSWARKTTRVGTKPITQQGKKITKNASLSLIQD